MSNSILRLITGFTAAFLAIAGTFLVPSDAVFVVTLVVCLAAAAEFVRIVRRLAPSAPLGSALGLVAAAAVAVFVALRGDLQGDIGSWLGAAGGALVLVSAAVVLFGRTPVGEAMTGLGVLSFAVPYFAVPPVAFYLIHRVDPWLLFLLMAIVWLGDTAAYYVGSAIGRRRMSPVVSPNKTWEGAAASFAAAVGSAALWSLFRLGELRWELLALAAVTGISAQLGDLLESLLKRGAGVKDSSTILPGHGGIYDRLDAMLLAAPVFAFGLWLAGLDQALAG